MARDVVIAVDTTFADAISAGAAVIRFVACEDLCLHLVGIKHKKPQPRMAPKKKNRKESIAALTPLTQVESLPQQHPLAQQVHADRGVFSRSPALHADPTDSIR
jgi:hypothetical protein